MKTASTDPSYPVILHNPITFGVGSVYPDVATDLSGRIIWYYEPDDTTKSDVLTRPLQGGGNITIQDDVAWNPNVTQEQFLRQIDLAGNIVRETNMGVIQQELLAKGAVNGGPCTGFTKPAAGRHGLCRLFPPRCHSNPAQWLDRGFAGYRTHFSGWNPGRYQRSSSGHHWGHDYRHGYQLAGAMVLGFLRSGRRQQWLSAHAGEQSPSALGANLRNQLGWMPAHVPARQRYRSAGP